MSAEHLIEGDLAGRVLERALRRGGDFAEVYAESRRGLAMSIDESRIENVTAGGEEGAGIRVVSDGTTYFAHVDGLAEPDLLRAAEEASAALGADRRDPQPLETAETTQQHIAERPEDVPADRKADLLRELDERGRAAGADVSQLQASYSEGRRRVTVANSEGLLVSDDRTRTRIGVQAVARRGDVVETGHETRGAHRGFELLADDPGSVAEAAGRKAQTLLDAVPAPAGSLPVVVGGGFGGVLFHEMTGHGVEADHIQKGASVYVGKLGEQIAQPLLNAYDDGAARRRVGHRRDRRRGHAAPEDADRRGGPHRRLPLRPAAGAARRRRLHRQRAPRGLSPPADPADDQHLHRPRRRDARKS